MVRWGGKPHRIHSNPVDAVSNRIGLECLINSKVDYNSENIKKGVDKKINAFFLLQNQYPDLVVLIILWHSDF